MRPVRIFTSSVQKVFSQERMTLRNYLCDDPLISNKSRIK